MDNVTFRRRNRLKKHFVITSNVLLFGYSHVSDSAKLTYQVIDSFDCQDGSKQLHETKGLPLLFWLSTRLKRESAERYCAAQGWKYKLVTKGLRWR